MSVLFIFFLSLSFVCFVLFCFFPVKHWESIYAIKITGLRSFSTRTCAVLETDSRFLFPIFIYASMQQVFFFDQRLLFLVIEEIITIIGATFLQEWKAFRDTWWFCWCRNHPFYFRKKLYFSQLDYHYIYLTQAKKSNFAEPNWASHNWFKVFD